TPATTRRPAGERNGPITSFSVQDKGRGKRGKRKGKRPGRDEENCCDHARMSVLFRVAVLIAIAMTQTGALNPDERALAAYIDTHNAESLTLLERVVNINSGTQNFEGVREVGRVLAAEFDRLGFHTRWVDGAAFKRAGHLVADHPGTGPRILLIGHLDTVFEKDSPFQKFERLNDREA